MNVTQPSHAACLPPLLLVLSCFQVNHPNTPGSSTSILAWPVRPRYLPKAILSTLTWLHSPRPPAAPQPVLPHLHSLALAVLASTDLGAKVVPTTSLRKPSLVQLV